MTSTGIISLMMRWIIVVLLVLMVLVFLPAVAAQPAGEDGISDTAVYVFPDGKQLSLRYKRTNTKEVLRFGKLWTPGGAPAFLFTEAELLIGNTTIVPGAYSIYLIPGKDEWTFIVSGNVAGDSRYDDKQNILRARMEIGELASRADRVTIYFGMTGPKECDMRLDYGKTRAWIEFKESDQSGPRALR